MDIIKENSKGDVVIKVDERYYVVRLDRVRGQVFSTMYSDMPHGNGTWFANISDGGVKYVASARTRAAALAGLRRLGQEGTG